MNPFDHWKIFKMAIYFTETVPLVIPSKSQIHAHLYNHCLPLSFCFRLLRSLSFSLPLRSPSISLSLSLSLSLSPSVNSCSFSTICLSCTLKLATSSNLSSILQQCKQTANFGETQASSSSTLSSLSLKQTSAHLKIQRQSRSEGIPVSGHGHLKRRSLIAIHGFVPTPCNSSQFLRHVGHEQDLGSTCQNSTCHIRAWSHPDRSVMGVV